MAIHLAPVPLSTEQRRELESWSVSRTLPARQVQRAQMLLLAAHGRGNKEIAALVGCSRWTVALWRQRFLELGPDGLCHDAPRSGRPPTYGQDAVTSLLAQVMTTTPPGQSHWSTRDLAGRTGMSQSTVSRLLRQHRVQPHRTRSFKFSRDPALQEKVVDIVALYLNPPEQAVVLCVDEKPQLQALERAQPVLPVRPGQAEGRSHDYLRHGTRTLFAALNVHDGRVLGRHFPRHRHQEFLVFLDALIAAYPRQELHLVVDNLSTHGHPAVHTWLRQHRHVHLHFTPTGASWMNQVECWFSILQRKVIARGNFSSLRALMATIHTFIARWNQHSRPFVWVKTAEQILPKAMRTGICESVY